MSRKTQVTKTQAQQNAKKVASPEDHYDKPRDVVIDPVLSVADKEKALGNWELNERLIQVADDEGMAGPVPDKLDEVGKAQLKLGTVSDAIKAK